MAQLQYLPLQRGKDERARLLTTITSATRMLIRSYALSMLRVRLPKASDSNPAVGTNTIMRIGEVVMSAERTTFRMSIVQELMIARLKDSGDSKKHDTVLHSVGQVCAPIAGSTIRHSACPRQDSQLKEGTGRASGREGHENPCAIDPYRRKLRMSFYHVYKW
ncbi:hypothetical protein EXIGLDRAFT_432214 [Exidia glandulosa HHB12029]|uniref:Uncharacterized protein n=1 Tax=Exidia glandulosa HHB12029 TaxID=1314781 RepID=A0A165KHP2_EXIGL|nr:hypothetical protein EXIGLDRAFT_432214 [Exidia glandulosa HHB12029]